MINYNLPWFISIFLLFLLELIISIVVVLLWIFVPCYSLIFKDISSINNFDLIVLIYFCLSWLYAVYMFIKHSISIPNSLLIKFPFFLKDIVWRRPINRTIFWGLLTLTVILWYLLNNPLIETNQLNELQSRLKTITESVQDAVLKLEQLNEELSKVENIMDSDWQKFSNYPQPNQIPRDRDDIKTLSNKYQDFLSDYKLSRSNVSKYRHSILYIQATLKGNDERLVETKNQLNTLCKSIKDYQQESSCSYLFEAISELDKSIASASNYQLLQEYLDKINSIKNSSYISDKILAKWEKEIEEALGKFNFDIREVNKWLSEVDEQENTAGKTISRSQNLEKNLPIQKDKYSDAAKQILEQVKDLEISVAEIERQSQSSRKVKLLLGRAVENNGVIEEIQQKINQQISEIKSLESEVQDNMLNLNSTVGITYDLINIGEKLSVRIEDHSKGEEYIEKILAKNLIILELNLKSGELLKKWEGDLVNQVNLDIDRCLSDLYQGLDLIQDVKSRSKKLEWKFRWVILRIWMIKFILVMVSLGILIGLGFYRYRMNTKNLGKNWQKLKLTITKSQELLAVRLKAVDIIKETMFPSQEEIDDIKSVIIELYKSGTRNDLIVASKLNKVAESFELRLTEQRRLG